MKEIIVKILSEMESGNNELWTGDGLPRVDYVSEETGLPELTRKDITEAAPLFSRETLNLSDGPTVNGDEVAGDGTAGDGDDPENVANETSEEIPSRLSELEIWQEAQEGEGYNHNHPDIVEASEYVDEGQRTLAHSKSELAEAEAHYRAMVEKHAPAKSTARESQLNIMNHISKQNEMRQNRKASGADIMKMINARSKAPIDAVAARKSGFGKARQVRGATVKV